ncbi:MAG: Tol-Pal system beta propeller repeat protein TolB [Deltaproteobacteria bacterium RIFOXYA12_FULL_58_15]|nr:MAG: Tol-Pal system beta propeller repeat protein TolB [Deltaproteobacteria bacterium RIFOXYA12_FULL_58_15]OGR13151.1 MAG: Tol-Pal system beta propeller repeat protein TolB [Deltaproteobacteria bacterium RIFOXYB12_FULL_58_9]
MICRLQLFALLSLIWTHDAHAQRLRIVVGGANFRPYPIAVPEVVVTGGKPKPTAKLASELSNVLRFNVDLARSLELIQPKTYLAPENESWTSPSFPNWVNVGASGLIWGGLQTEGDRAKVTLRFFDVVQQTELVLRTYDTSVDNTDKAVYEFLDEIIQLLTGEPGVFSSRITYVKRTAKGKAVYICDIDGRNNRRVTPADVLSLLPAWAADGRSLLLTSYLKSNPDLFRLDLGSGDMTWLSNKRGLNTGAAVSPDGTQIALTLSIDGNTEIYVMDNDGTNLRRLTDSWAQDISPTWSPDGKKIAFVSSRSGNPHIYVMNVDGSNPRRLTFQGSYNQEPDWSPRPGGQIAFTARDERLKYDIFLVHPESGEITRLTQDEGNNESPSHSPDGHHLVFTSTRGPQEGKQLLVMDVDGNNQRRITRDPGDYETPAWGPRLGWK